MSMGANYITVFFLQTNWTEIVIVRAQKVLDNAQKTTQKAPKLARKSFVFLHALARTLIPHLLSSESGRGKSTCP